MAYGSYTKYTGELAAADRDWSALGSVDVTPDTGGVYEDVGVYDVNDPAAGWSGLWDPTAGTHEIYMNDAFLGGYDPPTRQAVMEHEFGHALRLGHRNDSAALMHCYDNERVPIAPAPSDIAQYRSYWG